MPQIRPGPSHWDRKVEYRFRSVLFIGRKHPGKTAWINNLLRNGGLSDTGGLLIFNRQSKRQRTRRWPKIRVNHCKKYL